MAICVNQHQLQTILQRGKRDKLEAGIFLGNGPVPYGYIKVGQKQATRLEIVPETGAIVQRIYHWFVHDQLGMAEITRCLQAHQILPPGKPDHKRRRTPPTVWRSSTIRQILRHEVYAGTFYANRYRRVGENSSVLRPREEWIPIAVPALVERDRWEAAQTRLCNRRPASNSSYTYLMHHRLRCACGYAVSGTPAINGSGQVYLYYECGQRHRGYTQCDMRNTRADLVDTAVREWIVKLRDRHACASDASLMIPPTFGTVDFAEQRRVVEALDLHGMLALEGGQRILDLQWQGETHRLTLG